MICVLSILVLLLSVFGLPEIWKGGSQEFPSASIALFFIMIGMYVTLIPFFIGLWNGYKLLGQIDKEDIFSNLSVSFVGNIKYCSFAISVLYVFGVPLLFPIAEADDAPGIIIFGAIVACIPVTIFVFSTILEKLLKKVILMKSEKDSK